MNTNVWLASKGISLKPFSFGSRDDTASPMGRRSKLRTKNKQDITTPTKAPKLNFTIGTKKGKAQGEPSTSNVHETQESEVLDEQLEGENPDEEPIDVD